jgi:hypothetical protein
VLHTVCRSQGIDCEPADAVSKHRGRSLARSVVDAMTYGGRLLVSLAFLGLAYVVGRATHSPGAFRAIIATGTVTAIFLRIARR